jgi:hypothetical protein
MARGHGRWFEPPRPLSLNITTPFVHWNRPTVPRMRGQILFGPGSRQILLTHIVRRQGPGPTHPTELPSRHHAVRLVHQRDHTPATAVSLSVTLRFQAKGDQRKGMAGRGKIEGIGRGWGCTKHPCTQHQAMRSTGRSVKISQNIFCCQLHFACPSPPAAALPAPVWMHPPTCCYRTLLLHNIIACGNVGRRRAPCDIQKSTSRRHL